MNSNDLIKFIPLLSPLLLISMWMFVSKILSLIGGWHSLSEKYRSEANFSGTRWQMQSARLGFVNYRSVITFGADYNNIFISVMFLFRLGHPNLIIPFYDVTGNEHKGVFFSYVNLTFKKAPRVKIKILKGLADKIENVSNWKYKRL